MIFCIIPAFNEEKKIIKVITEVLNFVDRVIIIDDASRDNTLQILEKNLKNNKKVIILKHLINRGQGAALATGNQYALKNNADIIVHFDADGQFLAEDIKEIIQPIQAKKADIVFGSRFLSKTSKIPALKKFLILPLAKIINKLAIKNYNLTDPQSGFRAMNKNAAEKIKITQNRMAHCSEIISQSFKLNLKIKEVPIAVIYHEFGQKFSGGLKIIKDLFLGKLLE